jgi:hypothetical protein
MHHATVGSGSAALDGVGPVAILGMVAAFNATAEADGGQVNRRQPASWLVVGAGTVAA